MQLGYYDTFLAVEHSGYITLRESISLEETVSLLQTENSPQIKQRSERERAP